MKTKVGSRRRSQKQKKHRQRALASLTNAPSFCLRDSALSLAPSALKRDSRELPTLRGTPRLSARINRSYSFFYSNTLTHRCGLVNTFLTFSSNLFLPLKKERKKSTPHFPHLQRETQRAQRFSGLSPTSKFNLSVTYPVSGTDMKAWPLLIFRR